MESFLPGGVPDLKLYSLALQLDRLDLEVDSFFVPFFAPHEHKQFESATYKEEEIRLNEVVYKHCWINHHRAC